MQRCQELSLVGNCSSDIRPPAAAANCIDTEDEPQIDLVYTGGMGEEKEEKDLDKVDFVREGEQWVIDPWEKVDELPDPIKGKLKQLQEDKYGIVCIVLQILVHSPVHLYQLVCYFMSSTTTKAIEELLEVLEIVS